jgi:pimeloyl-ACP methyl ester carboxylesterase
MATTMSTARENGAFVDVDGVATYYEVTGAGDPVLLLHGGMCPAESLDTLVPTLAGRHRVYVAERFGHGRTAAVEGAITYENMAQHTIAFMEAAGVGPASLAGWSDGALVALLVALRRPTLVRKLVLIDQFVTLVDAPPGYLEMMAGMTADTAPEMFVSMYRALSPDGPDHWPVVFEKLRTLWTGDTGVEVADLARVACPTLVLVGDDGCVTFDHLAAIARTLPDAQVAMVPGTSHGLPLEKPDLVNRLLLDFLGEPQVEKLFRIEAP